MLTWIHFGDLHASDEDGWQSLADLKSMIASLDDSILQALNFAYLPGDNANHGTVEQYERIRDCFKGLPLALHVIAGDHDFEPGSLASFYAVLGARKAPYAVTIEGHRCLFLDMVSPGKGGPDFRLGPEQTRWLHHELEAGVASDQRPVVFMHAFPEDLAEGSMAVQQLFDDRRVVCVDTGHTHYNEAMNDGSVVYTATRSTGQVEEGAVGFSVHAVDGSVVSWRFKEAARPWPFVLITSPSDHRLITDASRPDQVVSGLLRVRAKVLGRDVVRVRLSIDGSDVAALTPGFEEGSVWSTTVPACPDGHHTLTVTATAADGSTDADAIEAIVSSVPPDQRTADLLQAGGPARSIGEWRQRGLLGTQLGPNKKGRKW